MNSFLQTSIPPDWSLMIANPNEAKEAVDIAIREAKTNIDSIKSLPDSAITFENSVRALDRATLTLDRVWTYVNHLQSVADSEALRNVIETATPIVSEFSSGIYMDSDLFAKILVFANSDFAKNLGDEQKKLLEETILDFKESGANLSDDKKKQLVELDTTLTLKTQKFSENVLDSTMAFSLNITQENDLDGLPVTAIELAEKKAKQKGMSGWCFTLEQPSFVPFMQYASSRSLREKMWRAFTAIATEGKFDNKELMSEILQLRKKESELLDKDNFADMVLSRRMAKTGKNALDFVENLHDKFFDTFEKESKELTDFAIENSYISSPEELMPWDIAYISEKMRLKNFDFDSEAMRPYFPLENVLKGMFEIFGTLFGISVEESNLENKAWNEYVKLFTVRNSEGKELGLFYADFFPRTQKRAGAWMNLLAPAVDGKSALGLIAANVTEPTDEKPALLSHDEVETLFHEFGHLVHFFLMDSQELGLREVAWDFVELPSQIMENWTRTREGLNLFARHWETSELIPDSIYLPFHNARKFMGASACMRQLSFAKIDLELHLNSERFIGKDIETQAEDILKDYVRHFSVKVPSILPRFTHIFGDSVGYAAGYYSYKWAEVLDADAFSRFEKAGILNSKVGKEFAEKILRVGNTKAPEEAFRDFMGRNANPDALVARSI